MVDRVLGLSFDLEISSEIALLLCINIYCGTHSRNPLI